MKRSQLYMLVGAILLSGLFLWPLWNITLEAPQYPDAIGMDIHINKFEDANPNDIKNINIMNHYVGMKDIPETIPEFSIFPKVALGMIILGVIIAFIGKRPLYITWFALMLVLGTMAMYDFYQWEYDYGHDLKENAAIKFTDDKGQPMAYQPPLIGSKMILNFRAISMPRPGAYLMFLGMALSVLAFIKAKKEQVSIQAVAALLVMGLISGCSFDPQPIIYGQDACVYCKMTIVDKQHSAQVVTNTGKAFKYDAIECMLNDLKEWERPEVKYYLVADYTNPGQLADAINAHYLISESIPSPMGEFLTAFENANDRLETMEDVSGQSLSWTELKAEFDVP
ncbi:nitrous oxide reductase accessory protein NosL [Ekhidna sp.]|uniref:nitrous oxide reductase accessory protein NosL n=1 Tax=Ekhidna sp. TaxID=2608089 RepID=UPI003298241C